MSDSAHPIENSFELAAALRGSRAARLSTAVRTAPGNADDVPRSELVMGSMLAPIA